MAFGELIHDLDAFSPEFEEFSAAVMLTQILYHRIRITTPWLVVAAAAGDSTFQ